MWDVCLCSIYLLNAASREERQRWMIAVKKCQVALSPKPSPQPGRKIVAGAPVTKANTEAKVTDVPSKSPDQAAFDSDSSGSGDGSLGGK